MGKSRLQQLEAVIASATSELAEISAYGVDDFPDETTFMIKKTFVPERLQVMAGLHHKDCDWLHLYDGGHCTCGGGLLDQRPEDRGQATYTYTAVKIKGGWYLTGAREQGRKTWDEFVSWLRKGTVVEAWIVTAWEQVDGWS